MNLEFLSGLALIVVALGTLAFIITGLVGLRVGDLKRVRRYLATAFEKFAPSETKPVNQHLYSSIGKVVAHSGDSARPLRVRLNLESWPARLASTAQSPVEIGTLVKVTDVDGPILVVEVADDIATPSDAST